MPVPNNAAVDGSGVAEGGGGTTAPKKLRVTIPFPPIGTPAILTVWVASEEK